MKRYMKICEYIARFLKQHGVKDVFGVPGSWIMPIWQELGGIIHLCNNEADAAYMATGYGKKSRTPGVVITTAGPGITNAVSGIASAYQDSIPLIHISGCQSVKDEGTGCFQEESDYDRCFLGRDLLDAVTKKSFHPATPSDAIEMIHLCWHLATSNRQGSVHISIPIDIQNSEADICTISHFTGLVQHTPSIPFKRFSFARPLIIIGWGAYMGNASDCIYKLAEKINSPVLSTMKGMSGVRYGSDYHLGSLGFHYTSGTDEFLYQYQPENVYIFGSSVGKKDYPDSFLRLLNKANVICFTGSSSNIGARLKHAEIYETEDLKETISELVLYAPEIKRDDYTLRLIRNFKEKYINDHMGMLSQDSLMASAVAMICRHGRSDVVLTADAGNHYLDAITFSTPIHEGSFFVDVGLAAMGIGISETIGMAYSDLSEKYIAITGDGCMLMNGNSIYAAVRDQLPIIFVVFNNQCLGRVREGQRSMSGFVGSDLGNVCFRDYAIALGFCNAYQTNNIVELKKHIDDFLNASSPYFVEFICSKDEIPLLLRKENR